MSDLHGSKDITMDFTENIVLDKKKSTILGSTVNNILLSLFAINCHSNLNWNVPGGTTLWKAAEESLCVMLLTITTIEHMFQRIFHLVLSDCFDINSEEKKKCLAKGSLCFVRRWTTRYWRYITPQNRSYIPKILRDFLCSLLKSNSVNSSIRFYEADIRSCITSCSVPFMTENTESPEVLASSFGTWDKASEKSRLLDGSLEAIENRKAVATRNLSDTPAVIAIFGVTQDILDDSEEEEEGFVTRITDDNSQKLKNGNVSVPTARIPNGFNLLQDYHGVGVWDFDVKEFARQWTLMDHRLFIAIPLTELQNCQWTKPRFKSEGNMVRRFIDRFNTESCWVTESLLNQATPQKRAALYMKFIFLASFLEELHNFNGVMAILTAMQQGCITRLKDTLSFVDEKTKQNLKRLQVLMSGSMNYAKYRTHLIDLLNEDNKCVIPHLGAHLAEICSIEEGNSSHTVEASHLVNIEKLGLISRCLVLIEKMQSRRYDLFDIRIIQVCLLSELQCCQHLSTAHAAKWSKRIYEKSCRIEGATSNFEREPIEEPSSPPTARRSVGKLSDLKKPNAPDVKLRQQCVDRPSPCHTDMEKRNFSGIHFRKKGIDDLRSSLL